MPIGTCRLCLTPGVELRDSHFVPRAFYKLFRERGVPGSDPVMSSQEQSVLSQRQAHDYLLCGECEERFNKGGESWLLANCWRDPARFPLRDRLIAAGPSPLSSPGFTIFETATIPDAYRDKLAYFGVSVFWRAAVHRWHLPSGNPVPITLGKYEDGIRKYLLGTVEFPRDVVILVSVSYSTDEMKNKFVTFPWLFKRDGGQHQFKLIVPGITFQLCVGKIMPDGLRRMCTARSEKGLVYMSERTDDINMQGNLAMLKTAKRVGKLAKRGGVLLSDGTITRRSKR